MDNSIKTIYIREIGKISMCKRVLKEETLQQGEVPFYKISTFGGQADSFISKELFEEYKSKYPFPKKGDILISAAGTVGKTVIYNGEAGYFQDSNIVWVDNDETKVRNDYLYYFFQTKPWLTTDGSTITRIYNENLRSIRLTVPVSLTTQQKIASVLSALDAKIELNRRINAELEAMAKTLYDYWFVQFDFPDAQGRPYKSSGGKMVWCKELGREVPEGWGVEELGRRIDLFDSKRIPLSSREREQKRGNIPYYGATGVMDYVNEYIFDGEYILLAEDGSVMDENGFPIMQFIWGKSWVNNHAHVIRAKQTIQNEFYFQQMNRIPVVLIKTGSIQMKINQENLKKYPVLVPPKKFIEDYSIIAKSIREELKNIFEQNQHLSTLRDWLLPMLMNGQVRVG